MIHRLGRVVASAPRLALICTLILTLAWTSTLASARPVTLVTTDGRRIEATLVSENNQQVVVEVIEGVRATFDRSDIESIEPRKTLPQLYRERRAELDDDDFAGRYELAYFLFQEKAYDLARRELNSILNDFEEADRAQRLLRVLDEREKTAPSRETPSRPDRTPAQPSPTDTDGDDGLVVEPLTEQEISMIRLWEMPANDEAIRELAPRVTVPRDVIERFIEAYRDQPGFPDTSRETLGRIRNAEGYQQLLLMMRMRARDFYDDVLIRDDPPSMLEFRRTIHRAYVWNYLEPTFGDGAVEGLKLDRFGNPLHESTVYTNFLALHEFEQGGSRMIDRNEPERSLMLQWGLPRDQARVPAPDVPRWRPYFSSTEDPRYGRYLQWIRSLYPEPRYGVSLRAAETAEEDPAGSP